MPSPEKVQDSDTSGRERHANRASAKRPRRSWAKRHRASLLARAKAAAAEKAQRTLACLWKSPRDRVRRWWRSFLAHEERRRKAVQRQPQHYYYRTCRIEGLETRLALTPTTVTLALPGYVLNGVNVLTSDQRITSALIDDKTNQPTAWTNGDTLVIPPSFANTTIAIQDSGGNLTPIAAAEIDVQAPGVALEGLASTDVLAIDPANPTTLVADGAADFATISAPISPLSAGTTIIRTTGNSGTFVLDAAAAVSTITASAGAVEVGADAGINAATISVSGGTFTIDATSATSRQLTATTVNITGGTFKIDATTATPPPMQLVATTVNVYSGAFDVEGNLSIAKTGTVAGSLTVSGSAVLQGAATGLVTLAAGCGLVYTSSQDCDFLPQISGAGYLDVNCPAGAHAWGATFTLDNGKNSYTGGTQVYAGELKMGRIGGFNNPSYGPLALYGTSVFDVNDNSCYVLSLYGDPDVTITNSAAPESPIPAVIIGSGGSGSSTFAGTTLDGSLGGEVGLDVEDTTLTLTPTANIASFDGIILGGARLVFNETGNAVNVACSIRAANLKSFIDFNVAENAPTTFTGSISSDTLGLDLEKDGPGTLTLAPAACAYWNMSVLSGTLVYGNANAVPGGSNIDVNDGATLDGGGVPFLPPFYEVTMYGGTITDGVFGATGNIVVYSGIIDASAALSGAALLDKERSSTAPGSGTLALNGTVEAVSATVNAGTLQVDGTLTSNVTVNNAAVLSTAPGSLITGSIAYNSSATSTIHGQIDDSTGGATVTGGTFVVTSPAGLADGSALTVGDPGAFAAPLAPQVMSLRYNGPSIATTGLVTYTLYLNESVTGVDPSDFSIDSTGASGTIASVSGSGNRYLITVSVSGSGTLALKMTNPGDIADANGKTIPASTLPIASSTALVNPTLYWSGSGDWTSGAWKLSDGTTTPWIDGSRVVLAAGSELTLNGTVHVASITAMGTASIDGGTICLVTPPSPPAPLPEGEGSIKVVSGVLRVNSTIAGAADWSKLGGGILVLEGPMIYTGTATVAAGTLLSAAALPSLAVLAGGDALTATDIVSGDAAGTSFAPTISALVPMLLARDGGTISRADMIQILQSAIVDGSLSDEALAALDALTTPSVSATLGEAQYVSVLASDVVNVNPANEHFEGQILGDLDSQPSPQARATALTDLIGKWFEGIDLPAVTYPQYYTYTVTAGSLYGTAGVPSSADMAQGAIGDCYFISTLGSIASSNPAAIRDMIIDNGDGSYTIRFYYNAGGLCTADYVTVNSSLPGNCGSTVNTAYAHPGPQGGFWLCLIEKAYAQWNETGREGRDGTNSYAALSGGFMGAVDQQVLGSDAQTYCPATGPAAEQAIISAIRAGKAVQAAIFTDGSALFSQLQLVSCHAYDVASCDPVTATFTLLNPWGGYEPQPLTWANFVEYCPWFNVADASNTTPAAAAAASAAGPASAGTASAAPALSAAAVVGYFARAAAPDAFAPLTPNLGAIDAVMATCAAT